MPALKVATLNLYSPPFRTDERAALVAQGLRQSPPDLIGFQEVNIAAAIGNRICETLNASGIGDGPPFRVLHVANPGREVTRSGLAVVTRLPVVAHEAFDYLIEGLEWNRSAQRVRVDAGGLLSDFYNTHFHYLLGPEADEIRCTQVRKLLAWMDSHGREAPKALVGDLNAWPDSQPVRLLKERLTSAYTAVHGREPDKTWPTPLLRQPSAPDWTLDYIFVAPGVRVADASLTFTEPAATDAGLYASDHFGLVATVDIG